MAAPKRSKDRDFLLDALVARDGALCFLCGVPHRRTEQLQVDWVDNPCEDLSRAFVACKTCVRRRDGKPLGGYLKSRMTAARLEYEYLSNFAVDETSKSKFDAPIVMGMMPHAVAGTGLDEPAEPTPWDGLTPTLYVKDFMVASDYNRETDRPKDAKPGDVYQCDDPFTGELEEWVLTLDGKKWRPLQRAQADGLFPEDWPPADAPVYRPD